MSSQGPLTSVQLSLVTEFIDIMNNCCFPSGSDTDSSIKKELCRLKWNWLFIILLSSLGTINTSSPLGTLHQFVTNPSERDASIASLSMYEPGLGGSEYLYAWSISVNNIGGFLGALLGVLFSNFIPYWYGFLFSLLCHITGFLLYGLAQYGWMILLSRLLAGIFTGLQRALAFSYFSVSYEHYVTTIESAGMKESKSFCRVKDVLFSLYTVSTSIGLLVGAGFSAVIARVPHLDYFRAVGWYNLGFGILLLLLLVLTFHGEYCWTNKESIDSCLTRYKGHFHCDQRAATFSRIIVVVFLILSTAIVKARISVYEELFNPILSDSFGFSEDITVYFFLLILIAPILGGVLLLLLEWTHITNLLISVIGILATISGLLLMTDWQAIPEDPCLKFSVYHHPELLSEYSIVTQAANNEYLDNNYCWWLYNETITDLPKDIFSKSRLQVVFDPLFSPSSETINCDLSVSHQSCGACLNANTSSQLSFQFLIDSSSICYDPTLTFSKDLNSGTMISVLCTFQNSSCISACFMLNDNSNVVAKSESINSDQWEKTSQSFIEVAYEQSVNILKDSQYHVARNVCEMHQNEDCHWIPDSLLINEHCVDCQPICRGIGRTLNFVQFVIGSLWFMFTIPIAEVSLPIVISDAVSQKYQGLVMSCTVASTELLQGITPLWLNAAYESAEKRTFLPLLILVGTILPSLLGLVVLYCLRKYDKVKDVQHLNSSSQESSKLLQSASKTNIK